MKQNKITLNGNTWDVILHIKRYGNNRIAIECLDVVDGSPVAMATINLPHENLKDNEVFIKDYSENQGMLDSLVNAGIISKPIEFVKSGYVHVPKCKLLWDITEDDYPEPEEEDYDQERHGPFPDLSDNDLYMGTNGL